MILAFLIIILIVPIPLTIKVNYNALKNLGVFGIKFWFLKFNISSFKLIGSEIEIKSRATQKVSKVELSLTKEQVLYFENLINQFKNKIKIKLITFSSIIGLNNAFDSAMVSGLVGQIACGALAFIKNFKQTGTIQIFSDTKFNNLVLKGWLKIKVSISVYEFLYSFIMALFKFKRRVKYERKIRERKFGGKYA